MEFARKVANRVDFWEEDGVIGEASHHISFPPPSQTQNHTAFRSGYDSNNSFKRKYGEKHLIVS